MPRLTLLRRLRHWLTDFLWSLLGPAEEDIDPPRF